MKKKLWNLGGGANRYPKWDDLNVYDHVLKGSVPEKPIITKDMHITAFGSCFAANILHYLNAEGYNTGKDMLDPEHKIPVLYHHEIFVNTFSMRQQFAWALGDEKVQEHLWFSKKAEPVENTEEVRLLTEKKFLETDVFILTLGLTEIWRNKKTKQVLWGPMPDVLIEEDDYEFHVSSFAENYQNLLSIYREIRCLRPEAIIIFTLSPIPLNGSFRRDIAVIPANVSSKATLRAALDAVISYRNHDDKIFYYPAYEIVKEYFTTPYDNSMRYPKEDVLNFVISTFAQYFLVKE